ncbi:DctP family TRAP transporter solute-binding subunit [Marinobacterium sp. D7]|uniref:DctP family TRAP transporter solute-binding subunit n=1 Tax=Marinobacterium ramblicola TaxID=2849041 RepID=UPI001C2D98E4|nr:DctP family TRAP transporter solute-binding subunit [Marinobacterium ramblicola]MBV1787953.1 DctP family TRAP transporter solute-binding subunit [Marinobacterium ramblicola]
MIKSVGSADPWRERGSVRMTMVVLLMLCVLGLLIFWPPTGSMDRVDVDSASLNQVQRFSLRLGHNMPVGSAMDDAARRFARLLAQRSQGRIEVEVYPDQQLGNDHQMVEMARRGELDLILTPSAKLSVAIPEMQYADLPFYFPTPNDLYTLLDGEPGRMLLDKMSRVGLVGITFWGNGFKHFTANRPLLEPDDFRALHIRIMKSRLLQQQFSLLGAEPVAIDFHQVRQALMDGVVDGQENPLAAIHSMGIYQVQSDLMLSSHAYLAYVLSASETSFSRLPATLKHLVIDSARELNGWERDEIKRREAQLLSEIEAAGVTVHSLGAQQRELFRRRLRPLVDRFETTLGADLIALSDQYLQQRYRENARYLIGVDVDLTPTNSEVGLEVKRGAQLALEKLADNGLGLHLGLTVLNNNGQPSRAERNIEALADDPRVMGVIGGVGAAILNAQIDTLNRRTLVMISPWLMESGQLDAVTKPYLFGVTLQNDELARYIARLDSEVGGRPPLLVVENSAWGDDLAEWLTQELLAAGRSPSAVLRVNPGMHTLDMTEFKLIGTEPGTLVLALRDREQEAVVDALAAACPECTLVSVLGGVLQTTHSVICVGSAVRESSYTELSRRYEARYGSSPKIPSALRQGYDSTGLLATAILAADRSSVSDLPVRVEVKRQLERPGRFEGVIRRYDPAFTERNHSALDVADYRHADRVCEGARPHSVKEQR